MFVSCNENYLLSKYDIDIYVDDNLVETMVHGIEKTYALQLDDGLHSLEITKEAERDVKAEESFSVSGDTTVECQVSCESSKVNIEDFRVTSDEGESASASAAETRATRAKNRRCSPRTPMPSSCMLTAKRTRC